MKHQIVFNKSMMIRTLYIFISTVQFLELRFHFSSYGRKYYSHRYVSEETIKIRMLRIK